MKFLPKLGWVLLLSTLSWADLSPCDSLTSEKYGSGGYQATSSAKEFCQGAHVALNPQGDCNELSSFVIGGLQAPTSSPREVCQGILEALKKDPHCETLTQTGWLLFQNSPTSHAKDICEGARVAFRKDLDCSKEFSESVPHYGIFIAYPSSPKEICLGLKEALKENPLCDNLNSEMRRNSTAAASSPKEVCKGFRQARTQADWDLTWEDRESEDEEEVEDEAGFHPVPFFRGEVPQTETLNLPHIVEVD